MLNDVFFGHGARLPGRRVCRHAYLHARSQAAVSTHAAACTPASVPAGTPSSASASAVEIPRAAEWTPARGAVPARMERSCGRFAMCVSPPRARGRGIAPGAVLSLKLDWSGRASRAPGIVKRHPHRPLVRVPCPGPTARGDLVTSLPSRTAVRKCQARVRGARYCGGVTCPGHKENAR